MLAGSTVHVADMAVQPDGRVILGGTFNGSDPLLARYLVSAPQVGSFTASPSPAPAGADVTLAASVVPGNPGAQGAVAQVAFYADSNNDGALDTATDLLLGYAVFDPSDGKWKLMLSTAGWVPGSYRLFGRATDGYGADGDPFELTLTLI
jgi:hypothetical protein